MDTFEHFLCFTELPLDIQNCILSLCDEKYTYQLSQVSKYFSENALRLSISCHKAYKLTNDELKKFVFIDKLSLRLAEKITHDTLRSLTNLKSLDLYLTLS